MTRCNICPRMCNVDRDQVVGYCKSGWDPIVNLAMPHYGEEPVISGKRGSGTIFFTYCNLRCVYCQNHKISQEGLGKPITVEQLAQTMLDLQAQGVHNINLVTPTHFSLKIRDAIVHAKDMGLKLPIVWNSSAYELKETLSQLEGLVDIFMPDFRYTNPDAARRFSDAANYPEVAMRAILEMFRQVGHLRMDDDGIAEKGVLIRLLVLPEDIGGIADALRWIEEQFGNRTFISLMSQYYPTHQALECPPLDRPLKMEEYRKVLDVVEELGMHNGYIQDLRPSSEWTPSFK